MHPVAQRMAALDRLAQQTRRPGQAAIMHAVAARLAYQEHPGRFRLDEIERGLGRLAAASGDRPDRLDDPPERVLHVASSVHSVGGHSRLLQRWIETDSNRRHDLVLTDQGPNVPAGILKALTEAGGQLHMLNRKHGPLRRASALKRRAKAVDLVVLHQHPDDVIPSLALRDGPPVALLNHADHVSWIGLDVATWIINLRTSGSLLTQRRRGVHPSRCLTLPIPLADEQRRLSRADAKARLSLPTDAVCLVTMANPYKYEGPIGLRSLVRPFLRNPRVHLLAVGAQPTSGWARLNAEHPGQVHAYGQVPDPSDQLDAADVYLDSYPMASLTSLLQAALRGTPTLSYMPSPDPEMHVLASNSPGLDTEHLVAHNRDAYSFLLNSLLGDPAAARQRGERLSASIRTHHVGPAWARRVDRVYESMSARVDLRLQPLGAPGDLDLELVALHASAEWRGAVQATLPERKLLPRGVQARLKREDV